VHIFISIQLQSCKLSRREWRSQEFAWMGLLEGAGPNYKVMHTRTIFT